MLYWQSLSSLIPGITIAFPQCLNVMLAYCHALLSLLPDSWHHDRLPSMSCSIGSLSSLIPGITIAFPQCHALMLSRSIDSLSSLIPGITIAFPQCHALLAVSPL